MMQCRICGTDAAHRTYQAKEMMLGQRDSHTYFQCTECSCLQIADIPADLAAYYPEHYYSYGDAQKKANPIKQFLQHQRDKYAVTGESLLGQLISLSAPNEKLSSLRPLALNSTTRILDVGCGAGHLLYSLKEIGYNNLLGLDPFNQADIRYPNGLCIEKRDIFTETSTWDVVMFHHSLEHLVDQHAPLKKAFDILAPNGIALVRIPTVSSYAWQHYGVDWVQLDAPRHLYLHSIKSMQLLAEQTGFTVEKIIYDSNAFQFWGSEQYQHNIALRAPNSWAENPDKSLFSHDEIKAFEQRSKEFNALNQGDQAAFYLRKTA